MNDKVSDDSDCDDFFVTQPPSFSLRQTADASYNIPLPTDGDSCTNEATCVRNTISIPGFFEPFSSVSHLLGALIFAAASFWLLRRGRGDSARMVSLIAFCLGAVFLLSMSGIYHMLSPNGQARVFVQRLDHAGIFVLIAGSFTPAYTILFRGWGRIGGLLLIWTIAVVGIAIKMIYFDDMPTWLGLSLYVGMGWLGVFPSIFLWRRYGFDFVQPLFWGGVAYSIGAGLEGMNWPILVTGVVEWHEVLHVAVLVGLGSHWAFNYKIADGHVQPC